MSLWFAGLLGADSGPTPAACAATNVLQVRLPALSQSSIFLTQNNCVNHRAKRAWWANGSRRNRFGNKRFFVGARISDLRRNTPRLSGLVNAPERGPRSRRIIGGSSRCESARVMESDLKRTDYSVSIKNRARSVFMGCLSRNT